MKLSQTRKIRTAVVDLGDGETFTIHFNSPTPDEWDAADEESSGNDEWANVLKLETCLVDTGLEGDDGASIPPTREGLRQVETIILNAMLAAIVNATLPKKVS